MSQRRPCDHCGLRPWTSKWDVTACAAGRRLRVAKLCDPCDVDLNALILRFVRHPRAEELIAAYIRRA